MLSVVHERRLEVAQKARDRKNHAPNIDLRDWDTAVEDFVLLAAAKGALDVNALPRDGRRVHHLIGVEKFLPAASFSWNSQVVQHLSEFMVHHEPFVSRRQAIFVNFFEESTQLGYRWVTNFPGKPLLQNEKAPHPVIAARNFAVVLCL